MDDTDERVTWQYDAATVGWLRALLLGSLSVLLGGVLAVFGLLAVAFGAVLLGADPAIKLLAVVLLLVGGPASLLYLLPMARDPAQRPPLVPVRTDADLDGRRLGVGALGGAVLLVGLAWVAPVAAVALFGLAVAGLFCYGVCASRGELDGETRTLHSNERDWDLSRLSGVASWRLGPVAVVRLRSTGPGSFGTVPALVVLPASVHDDARAVLDRVAEEPTEASRSGNAAVRIAATAMALVLLGVGGAVAWAFGPLGWYVLALCGLFGAVLLFVARQG